MPLLPEAPQVEGDHWYTRDGLPVHTLPRKDGKGERPTTLSDARRLAFLPSVTSVLKVVAKPGLETWKLREMAVAANRSPLAPGDASLLPEWTARVRGLAFAQVKDAALVGSEIHAALEGYWKGQALPDRVIPYCSPVLRWKQEKRLNFTARETVVTDLVNGYAGTCDTFLETAGGIQGAGDFKTRKTKPGEPIEPYPEQVLQIAAYLAAGGYALGECFGVNVYISTTEPGRVEAVAYGPETLLPAFRAFLGALELWKYLKNYDPAATPDAPLEYER